MARIKEYSRINFEIQESSWEIFNAGCFARIADATEAMANPYLKLLGDCEYLRRARKSDQSKIETQRRSENALRGQITKLKKRIAELEGK